MAAALYSKKIVSPLGAHKKQQIFRPAIVGNFRPTPDGVTERQKSQSLEVAYETYERAQGDETVKLGTREKTKGALQTLYENGLYIKHLS